MWLMLCCREWQAQLHDVLGSQCVGMLRLETGALKATYTNTLSSAQATVSMLMVVAGRRAAEAAIHQLQAVIRYASNCFRDGCPAVRRFLAGLHVLLAHRAQSHGMFTHLASGADTCSLCCPPLPSLLPWMARLSVSPVCKGVGRIPTCMLQVLTGGCLPPALPFPFDHGARRLLAQQPSKLPDFIRFRLEVRALRQQQEDLLVALPAQVADLYASVKAWGFRLPHNDQVGEAGAALAAVQDSLTAGSWTW